jgi:hypothetical protein
MKSGQKKNRNKEILKIWRVSKDSMTRTSTETEKIEL